MLFRKFRSAKHAEALSWHVHQMQSLEVQREACEREGDMAMVLAINFELVSHGSRALVALRKLEELEPQSQAAKKPLRAYFMSALELPAIRRDEVDTVERSTIRQLYEQHIKMMAAGGGADDTEGPEYLDPEDLEPPPKAVVEAALSAWVEETGVKFESEDILQRILNQLQMRWELMAQAWRKHGHVEPQPESSLEQEYAQVFGPPKTRRDRRNREGWIAANVALQKGFERVRTRSEAPHVEGEKLCTKQSIIDRWGIAEEGFDRKYTAYQVTLRMAGESSNWNEEIDDHAREIGALSEAEIQAARTDFEQAVLNRIQVALATGAR